MEQLAYEDAVDVYERALEVMDLMDEPDEARRCKLLLALGGAEASAARFADARRAFGRAAESARSLGRADYLVGAAIGIAMLSEAGKIDHRLVALIDEALAAIGPERTAARASLLSAKSQELYWIDAQGESKRLVEEAIEIAREVDAPTHALGGASPPDLRAVRPRLPAGAARDRRRDARARQEDRRRRERAPRPRLPDDDPPRARRRRRLRPGVRCVLHPRPTSCGCPSTRGRRWPWAACGC